MEANAVFALLPPGGVAPLQERFRSTSGTRRRGEVRWMCSWDTTEDDVDAFAGAVRELACEL